MGAWFSMVWGWIWGGFDGLGWFLNVSEVTLEGNLIALDARVELRRPFARFSGLRGQILETVVKSEGWGGSPGAE